MNFKGQYLQLQHEKIYYYTFGSGPTLLFIHGHRSDALRYQGLLQSLSDYVSVIAPDLPGCGQTPPYQNAPHTMQKYAQTLKEFIEKLELKNLILMGGSMGGIICLRLYPLIKNRVSKNILIATPADSSFFTPATKKKAALAKFLAPFLLKTRLIPWLIQKIINNDFLMRFIQEKTLPEYANNREVIEFEIKQWRAMNFTVWLQSLNDLAKTHLKNLDIQITQPTLIIETKKNQYYDSDQNLNFLKKIAPNHQVIFIPWETHVPKGNLSKDLFDQFRNKFENFLKN